MSIKHSFLLLTISSFLIGVGGCSDEQADADEPAKDTPAAEADQATATAEAVSNEAALMDPAKATLKAPEKFKAKFETTKGDFVVEVTRDWSPLGADRFYNLIAAGFYKDIAMFRVIEGFMAQFGVHGDPKVAAAWREARIKDDPTGKASNTRGMVSFAMAGQNTRTTQMFINFGNNANLDGMDFTPFGKVTEGMEVVDSIYDGYGEGAPRGRGPDQSKVQMEGNAYLKKSFPNLDYIKSVKITE